MTTLTKNSISFGFIEDNNTPYVDDNNSSYVVKGHIQFPGTDAMGIPSSVKLTAWMSASGGVGAYRIYDFENSAVIAEVTGVTNTTKATVDMGSLSNLTTDAALWEVQIKKTSGAGEVCLGGGIIW